MSEIMNGEIMNDIMVVQGSDSKFNWHHMNYEITLHFETKQDSRDFQKRIDAINSDDCISRSEFKKKLVQSPPFDSVVGKDNIDILYAREVVIRLLNEMPNIFGKEFR